MYSISYYKTKTHVQGHLSNSSLNCQYTTTSLLDVCPMSAEVINPFVSMKKQSKVSLDEKHQRHTKFP